MPLVYAELRRLAHRHMRGQAPGHPLQTTALVHEAYLRLIGSSQVGWQNRAHFFAVSAQLMRRVLVDAVRSRQAQKRGGGALLVSLGGADPSQPARPDLLALDGALEALASFDPRKARVVELRYFGGLTAEEASEVLKVSVATIERDWQMAKLWLSKTLRGIP
jgi:RNA polymerase sigma factor (TIGR02999 family)